MVGRACLAALTDALAKSDRDDVVLIDRTTWNARIDSTLDDVDTRRPRADALVVPRPDGLWEWEVRRDFVRSTRKLAASDVARQDVKKLAATLAGSRTKRRFEVALGSARDRTVIRAFTLFRRRKLRAWAGRVLRVLLAGYVVPSGVVATPSKKAARPTRRPKRRRRRPGEKRRGKFVSYVG